jgi:uncharacterized membrane protein SpoIIM required for sporulation
MVAVLALPLLSAYLGMTVYVVSLYFNIDYTVPAQLFAQAIMLTTVQGIIMVSAAVIVSSQTTSVRAANLLASFIIVPMALLIQAEAAALFWGNHFGLWWLFLALAITAVVLIRMGLHLFNREEMMGRDLDQIRLGWIMIQFRDRFTGKWENGRYPNPIRWYKQTFAIIPQLGHGLGILMISLVGALAIVIFLANRHVLPPDIQAEFTGDKIASNLGELEFMLGVLPGLIFAQNIRVLILAALLGVFTFGTLAILIFMLPWIFVGFAAGQLYLASENPILFVVGTILPHALIELPAILLAMSAALRWHLTVIAPPPNRTMGEAFIAASADFARVFVGLTIPMLFVAAYVEAYVTPQVLFAIYGV